jgi:hypothetical protein
MLGDFSSYAPRAAVTTHAMHDQRLGRTQRGMGGRAVSVEKR